MGGTGGAAAYSLMQRQERARRADIDRRREKLAEKLKKHGQLRVDDLPVEDLMCPTCATVYPGGSVCLACDVELLCASFVDTDALSAAPARGQTIDAFACESCDRIVVSGEVCERCGEPASLDLREPGDRAWFEGRRAVRADRRRRRITTLFVLLVASGLVILLTGLPMWSW